MTPRPSIETIERVLGVVRRYAAGVMGCCIASNATIGAELDLSTASVKRSISYLATQKILRVSMVPHPRGVERRIYVEVDPVYDDWDKKYRSGATHIPTGEQPVQIPKHTTYQPFVGAPLKPLVYLQVGAGKILHLARNGNPNLSICGKAGVLVSVWPGKAMCACCAGKKSRRDLTELGWHPHTVPRPYTFRSGALELETTMDQITYVYRKSQSTRSNN